MYNWLHKYLLRQTITDQNCHVCFESTTFLMKILFKENAVVFKERRNSSLNSHLNHIFFLCKAIISISSFAKMECFASTTKWKYVFFLLSMMDWCNFIKLFLWYSYWYSLVLAYECSKINLLNSYFYESLILVHSAHLFNFTKNTIRSSK